MKQVTIVDIARELNITPSTVSRALRNHPDVNEKTRERVIALAEEWDYHPNNIAQSLKKRRTNLIGVVVPQVRHSFFATVIAGITDIAEKNGYNIVICQSHEDSERELNNVRMMISLNVVGLLISVSSTTHNFDHFKTLHKRNKPTVFFDRPWNDQRASSVVVDDYTGAYEIVTHLISRGYKRIAHLAGPQDLSIGELRNNGYRDALRDHGMPIEEDYIVLGGLNEEDGKREIDVLLNLPANQRPDAIFTVTDPVAMGVYMRLKEANIKIPDDIAIAGFSDNPEVALVDPPLTTVRQPAYDLGKESIKILINQINNPELAPVNNVLPTELIIRKST